jgi:Domain of unknown function (DUF2828)
MSFTRGKKGHCEYSVSSDTLQRIEQLRFQINLGTKEEMKYIEKEFRDILELIANKQYDDHSKELFIKMYTVIAETRDIYHGKGLRLLSYMMIQNWYECYRYGAEEMLSAFVYTNTEEKSLGSWKDMKYFCDFCLKRGWDENHELILYVVEMINNQVKRDWEQLSESKPVISLVSKWIPREKSKMAWLHKKLVENYFPACFSTMTNENKERTWKKAAMEYRKIVSRLNRTLDTVQIKQCANQWSEINFSNVSKITWMLQKNAFFNVKKNGEPRCFTEDRILCSETIKKYLDEEEQKKPSQTIAVGDLVKEAIDLIQNKDKMESEWYAYKKKIINRLWGVTKKVEREKITIPMVDVSNSMKEKSLYTAIGLACRMVEHSFLGKRILTFGGYPVWISLDDCETFVDCIEKIEREKSITDINTNFYGALRFLIEAVRDSKMNEEEIKNMTFVILSDMQMDVEFPFYKPLYETIEEKCDGLSGAIPNICFWNVQTEEGFPCLFDKNASSVHVLSGDNIGVLKSRYNYETVRCLIGSYL